MAAMVVRMTTVAAVVPYAGVAAVGIAVAVVAVAVATIGVGVAAAVAARRPLAVWILLACG
jgi:hypothetical protein